MTRHDVGLEARVAVDLGATVEDSTIENRAVESRAVEPDPHAAAETRARRRFVAEEPTAQVHPDAWDATRRLAELLLEEAPLLGASDVERRARRLATELVGLGPVQALLDDPEVSDVLVNGPGEIWVERSGRLEPAGVVLDAPEIARCIERLVAPLGLRADRSHPVVDARLADGTRVSVVMAPLAVDGPVLAVRRHRAVTVPLSDFAEGVELQVLLEAVARRSNVVVYGPTGAGKTTLLNALASQLPAGERVITIEDVAELRLPGDHVVRLEARPGSADGVGRAGVRDLVRAALRLRPDRIVVGEVRGPEALDMIWAISTGHDGSFSTCHASGPRDALRRLETMCLMADEQLPLEAVREQITAAIDLLVGVGRCDGGGRRVTAVHRLGGDGSLRSASDTAATDVPRC